MSFLRSLEVGNHFFFLTLHYILRIQYLKKGYLFSKAKFKRQKLGCENVLPLIITAVLSTQSMLETESARSLWDKVYSRSHLDSTFCLVIEQGPKYRHFC